MAVQCRQQHNTLQILAPASDEILYPAFQVAFLVRHLPAMSHKNPTSLRSHSASPLMNLPPELHLAIIAHLPYPDALSLKHSSRYFYGIVYTGINLKIEWLISRRRLHLECPHDGSCLLSSDRNFCRGSVRLLMARRRQHGECEIAEGGRGCLVLGTRTCEWRKARSPMIRIRKWIVANVGMLVCVLIGSISLICMRFRTSM